MATVTPYNDLNGTKTISGTWTKISGPGPAAPGVYNGTLNFTGTTDGTSIYEYSVTSGGCTHTSQITYESITPDPRVNDDCAGAVNLTASITRLYNDERCPGMIAPTDSGVAAPAAWGSTAPDIWYKYTVPTSSTDVDLEILVDGSGYSDGIYQPRLAVYSGTCGALSEEDALIGADYTALANVTVNAVSTPEVLYIRIASTTANAGQFDLVITYN